MTDHERLQLRFEKSIQYGIDLQRAIEAHCRGEKAEADKCQYHSNMLNCRLELMAKRINAAKLALKGQ